MVSVVAKTNTWFFVFHIYFAAGSNFVFPSFTVLPFDLDRIARSCIIDIIFQFYYSTFRSCTACEYTNSYILLR